MQPPPRRRSKRKRELRAEDRRAQVDVEDPLPPFQRCFRVGGIAAGDAGVVVENVESAELALGELEHGRDLCRAADVRINRRGAAAAARDPGHRLPCARRVDIGHHDASAFARQTQGRGASDA